MEKSQRVMNLSVLSGVTLLKCGAEIFRVQDTMQRILDCRGDSGLFQAKVNEIKRKALFSPLVLTAYKVAFSL